jgi:hypothetical protein
MMHAMRWMIGGLLCVSLIPGAAATRVDGDDRLEQALVGAAQAQVADRQSTGTRLRLAQAGSTGGTLGKTDQSLSGSTLKAPAPETKPKAPPVAKQERGKGGCPNIVGTWNSWASAIWGAGDVVFKSDGNAMHNAGIPGKWWCDRGQLFMTWGENKQAGTYRLSADGKQITNLENGMVGFSR